MKIGIVINTNDPETVWNAFRFGVTSLKARHEVKIFLYGKGVESERIESEFNIKEQISLFCNNGGKILACESCLNTRPKTKSNVCMIGHQKDLLEIVEKSDKILTFG
ncbi:MAG: DsrE family protein [Nanoarchaeota archaeon]